MSDIIFETTDVFNNRIILYDEDLKHIETNHPELKGEEKAIKQTVEKADVVYKSKNFPKRSIFFKKGVHSKFSHLYTKAIVEYNTTEDKNIIGNITTAFVCDEIQGVKEGGIQYVNINNRL